MVLNCAFLYILQGDENQRRTKGEKKVTLQSCAATELEQVDGVESKQQDGELIEPNSENSNL